MSRSTLSPAVAALVTLVLTAPPVSAQGEVARDVDYVSGAEYAEGRDLLDIYMPEGADEVPVVVFFHGGGLRAGDKSDGSMVAARLVPEGVGVVSAAYRLSPTVMHPAHIEDAAAATAWVVDNIDRYGGDPDNVFVAGHSAGAYLAALLAVDPDHLRKAGVDEGTIRGSIPIAAFLYVEETAADRPKDVWGDDPHSWMAASVTPHIATAKERMLLIYADGDADWRRAQNDRFGKALRDAGNHAVQVVEVPNRTHNSLLSDLSADDDRIGELVLRFIDGGH